MAMDIQSTVSTWVCLVLSVILIAARLSLRRWKGHEFVLGDYWCASAAVLIIARLIGSHLLILYGSTRTLSPERRLELLDPAFSAEASKIVAGSKLILATRSLLVCILWCLKMAVLDLLIRLIKKMPFEHKVVYSFWAVLLSTFIASLVSVFVSCRPFKKYWQIHPDPGECVVGNTWLITYETSNIITDILLMVLPFSLILAINVPIMKRLRVFFLFSIGIFLITISIIRIILGKNSRVQRAHTLWASLEVLFATIVAVTPTIYALARNRHEHNPTTTQTTTFTTRRQTYADGTIDEDRYTTRAWTELNDCASRKDNTSVEEIIRKPPQELVGEKK